MIKVRKLLFFVLAIAAAALLVASYYYGRAIPFAQQWPLYEALRNTAAIIFAVVGAWLAIIYPERLKLSFGRNAEGEESQANLGLLLTPAVNSTIILVILLLIGVLAPIIKQIPVIAVHTDLLRGMSFFLLTVLTLWQAVIVVIAIMPVELLLNQTARENAERQIKQSYGSDRQRL